MSDADNLQLPFMFDIFSRGVKYLNVLKIVHNRNFTTCVTLPDNCSWFSSNIPASGKQIQLLFNGREYCEIYLYPTVCFLKIGTVSKLFYKSPVGCLELLSCDFLNLLLMREQIEKLYRKSRDDFHRKILSLIFEFFNNSIPDSCLRADYYPSNFKAQEVKIAKQLYLWGGHTLYQEEFNDIWKKFANSEELMLKLLQNVSHPFVHSVDLMSYPSPLQRITNYMTYFNYIIHDQESLIIF